jgi:hypothetical protein
VCMCRPTGYEIGSTQKYICCFIRVTHAIKLCVLETEEFFELIFAVFVTTKLLEPCRTKIGFVLAVNVCFENVNKLWLLLGST